MHNLEQNSQYLLSHHFLQCKTGKKTALSQCCVKNKYENICKVFTRVPINNYLSVQPLVVKCMIIKRGKAGRFGTPSSLYSILVTTRGAKSFLSKDTLCHLSKNGHVGVWRPLVMTSWHRAGLYGRVLRWCAIEKDLTTNGSVSFKDLALRLHVEGI